MLRYVIQKSRNLLEKYTVKPISKEYMLEFLPQNPAILDCGAHIGLDSIEFATMRPQAKVFAFEPVESIYTQLRKNTAKYKNIETFPLALSSKNEKRKMYISSGASDGSSSLLKPKEHLLVHPEVAFERQITVSCMSLDSWASKNRIKRIDLLWLDMQGAELDVLRTSKKILPTVTAIHTEVNLKPLYEDCAIYSEVEEFLLEHGFKRLAESLFSNSGNAFYVKQK